MNLIEQFESFAAAFETTVDDDDWTRLAKYFTEDATYVNIGGPDPKCEGRNAILTYFKEDVTNTDRRFDTRTLIGLSPPTTDGNRLSRRWRTYTLAGTPDLVLEGESKYLFEGTPLHIAITNKTIEITDLLLSAGADVNIKCEVGDTPLERERTSGGEVAKVFAKYDV